jgi:hypothetical protein
MIPNYLLSNTNAVLLEIQKIAEKRLKLVEIRNFNELKNVSIICSNLEQNKMIHITSDMLPFQLSNEIMNLIDDSIDQFDKDISSLNQHLKNL